MQSFGPAKRALATVDAAALTVDIDKPVQRISKRVTAAIDKLVSGECRKIAEAAAAVGMARESLSRALSKPHVSELMRQKVIKALGLASARAGATKVELLDSGSDLVRDRASSFILGLAGIQPANQPSVNLNIEVKAGYVIDLRDEPRTIDHKPDY